MAARALSTLSLQSTAGRSGTRIYFSGARTGVRRTLISAGLKRAAFDRDRLRHAVQE